MTRTSEISSIASSAASAGCARWPPTRWPTRLSWWTRSCAGRGLDGRLDHRHTAERVEATVDLLARQPGRALAAELLDPERRRGRAKRHGAPQRAVVVSPALGVEIAEQAARERVAGAGRVDHGLEDTPESREDAVLREHHRAVLALLHDHHARTHLHDLARRRHQRRLLGEHAHLVVVHEHHVNARDRPLE